MGRLFTTPLAQLARTGSTKVSALPTHALVVGIIAVFAAFLWVISVAPALVSIALTVAIAIAWCLWLEKHPDAHEAGEQ